MTDEKFPVTPEEIACACQGKLTEQVISGFELFNHGEYFEAHEVLEAAWRAEPGPVRELYRGILQISVAYYHLLRGNYIGAEKMFNRARVWLDPFPEQCRGIDLARFRQDFGQVKEQMHRLGPERLRHFDRGLMKRIVFSEQ